MGEDEKAVGASEGDCDGLSSADQPSIWTWIVVRKALVRTTTGLVFGLILAFVTIALSDSRPIRLLETWGSDLGMRILASPLLSPHEQLFKSNTPFLFVDIDRHACAEFVGQERASQECEDLARPPPDLIAALIRASEAGNPSAIIIDYQLLDQSAYGKGVQGQAFDDLIKLLTSDSGVPLIAPAPLRPDLIVGHTTWDGSQTLIEEVSRGRLRLAAFITWTDALTQDGVVRSYPPFVSVSRNTKHGRNINYLPSAPLLTAMVTSSAEERAKADNIFFASDNHCSDSESQSVLFERAAPEIASICFFDQAVPEDVLQRILSRNALFTISSITPQAVQSNNDQSEDRLRDRAIDRYFGLGNVSGGMLYRRQLARDLDPMRNGSFSSLTEGLERRGSGQIVILGSSAQEVYDWHATPLGRMTGAEVIINSTRAFQDFTPIEATSSPMEKVKVELITLLFSALSLFPFLFIASWCEARQQTLPKKVWLYRTIALVAVLVGVMTTIMLVSLVSYRQLMSDGMSQRIDFLLPVLAIAFEGLVDAAKTTIDAVEKTVLMAFAFLAMQIERLNRWFNARG